MSFLKRNWIKIGIGTLILVSLLLVEEWKGSSNPVLISNAVVSSATPSPDTDLDLPTIRSSELPDPFDENYDKDKYSFLHGGIVGDNGQYTKVLVEDTSIEEPVSISYSNEYRSLKLKSDAEIDKIIKEHKVGGKITLGEDEIKNWQKQVGEQLSKYGEIARQYLPYDAIIDYYTADINHDGVKEKLITICGISANHCSDYAEIVRGNEIIFSTQLYTNSTGIKPAPNGFYVNWTDEDSFRNGDVEVGACCELSHNKTQFIFKDGGFVPVKQWVASHIWKRVIEELVFTGKIFAYMTYGRHLFENLDPTGKYKYIIAEPEDEGITANIRYNDIVKIVGTIDDNCSWNDIENTEYKGCIPWLSIETIKKMGTDKNAKPPTMTCLASGICLPNE